MSGHMFDRQPFMVSIHDPTFVPNMVNSSHEVKPGTIATFTVQPQLITTSDELASTALDQRGCQFNFEGQSKIFRDYHQDGCTFECLVEHSFEYINCTPWNYPMLEENSQTCNGEGKKVFDEQMQKPFNIHKCQQKCPQECSRTLYSSFVSSETLDIDELCAGNAPPNGIIRSYEWMVLGKHLSSEEFCRETLKRFAIVRVRLVSNTVTSIQRSLRVTITGHISNIGE